MPGRHKKRVKFKHGPPQQQLSESVRKQLELYYQAVEIYRKRDLSRFNLTRVLAVDCVFGRLFLQVKHVTFEAIK